MNEKCIENLIEIKSLIIKIPQEKYIEKLKVFNGFSIGQHFRHIIEFYQCVVLSENTIHNYDLRNRDQQIEENIFYCVAIIDDLIERLLHKKENYNTWVKTEDGNIPSSYFRELLYALEHSIHHQALIKIGLHELDIQNLVHQNFGVAPSTIKHLEKCAH